MSAVEAAYAGVREAARVRRTASADARAQREGRIRRWTKSSDHTAFKEKKGDKEINFSRGVAEQLEAMLKPYSALTASALLAVVGTCKSENEVKRLIEALEEAKPSDSDLYRLYNDIFGQDKQKLKACILKGKIAETLKAHAGQ